VIRKLLCFFGIHRHVEIIDEQVTKEWFNLCDIAGFSNPTSCTYARCSDCGHEYGSRTVGVTLKLPMQKSKDVEG